MVVAGNSVVEGAVVHGGAAPEARAARCACYAQDQGEMDR